MRQQAGLSFEGTLAFHRTHCRSSKSSPERLATLADSTLRLFNEPEVY